MTTVAVGRTRRWTIPELGLGSGAWIGAVIVGLIVASAVLVPILSPYDPNALVSLPLQPPSWSHPLGTDGVGRDVVTRVFAAARIGLVVTGVAVSASLALGATLGSISVFSRRRAWELLLMRIVDVIVAFPFIVLVLALVMVLGSTASWGPLPPGLPALLIAIVMWDWTVYARVARLETRKLREAEYILAARTLGYPRMHILRKHVLPQVLPVVVAYAVADSVVVLITTAGLPFIGAGVQPPTAEWGSMMFEGRTVLADAWWVSLAPGIALALTGIGLTLLADGLLKRGREVAS